MRVEQRQEQLTGGGLCPVPRADTARDQPPCAVDHVDSGWAPDAVQAAGHVPAAVDQDRGDVAPLVDDLLHVGRVLTEVDEQYLKAPALQVRVELVDGRQLLPAV